ncbi:hypothetical protein EG329_011314 [Mollisiaceae sp. DMI_Dod_QoI]|nr:hypothetical protein EG329_011314 [Helotiales sp. DMI_Dod_QoI]
MNNDGSHNASESSPLIQSNTETGDVHVHEEIASKRKRRVILLLYAFAFTMMLGDNLQPAALTQIFEGVICDDYYEMSSWPLTSDGNTTSLTAPPADRCKIQPVQKELALVRGFQQLVPLIPALLCTVPYGILAERIGRKGVLILSGAGVFAAFSWVLVVCYWRFASIRWVLLSGAFLFIGGGDAVSSSLVHIMVTDATDQGERAQIFLNLHAADVLSGFLGPAISAPFMEKGYTWSVLLLAQIMLFSGTFLITQFIPETLNLRHKSSTYQSSTSSSSSSQITVSSSRRSTSSKLIEIPIRFVRKVFSLLVVFLGVLTSNRQAVLLLIIFAPQTAARELFTVLGLQYSRAKFSLPYARGNVLFSLFQGAQGILVLVLLPIVTRTIAEPLGWTAWARDRRYAIVSISVMAFGLMVIGFAPNLVIEVAGLLLVALGSCTTGLLMSLLGGAVRPNQVSTFYSAALTLSMVMRSVTGPLLSALLIKGMELGWNWLGLPFLVMAMLMAGVAVASGFIGEDKGVDDSE